MKENRRDQHFSSIKHAVCGTSLWYRFKVVLASKRTHNRCYQKKECNVPHNYEEMSRIFLKTLSEYHHKNTSILLGRRNFCSRTGHLAHGNNESDHIVHNEPQERAVQENFGGWGIIILFWNGTAPGRL